MSAARLVTGARNYDLIPLVLHVLAVNGVYKEGYWPWAMGKPVLRTDQYSEVN